MPLRSIDVSKIEPLKNVVDIPGQPEGRPDIPVMRPVEEDDRFPTEEFQPGQTGPGGRRPLGLKSIRDPFSTGSTAGDIGMSILGGVASSRVINNPLVNAIGTAVLGDSLGGLELTQALDTIDDTSPRGGALELTRFIGNIAPDLVLGGLAAKVGTAGVLGQAAKVSPTVRAWMKAVETGEEVLRPGLVRALTTAGTSLGFGTSEALITSIQEGATAEDVVRSGVIGAAIPLALGGALEGGLRIAGRAPANTFATPEQIRTLEQKASRMFSKIEAGRRRLAREQARFQQGVQRITETKKFQGGDLATRVSMLGRKSKRQAELIAQGQRIEEAAKIADERAQGFLKLMVNRHIPEEIKVKDTFGKMQAELAKKVGPLQEKIHKLEQKKYEAEALAATAQAEGKVGASDRLFGAYEAASTRLELEADKLRRIEEGIETLKTLRSTKIPLSTYVNEKILMEKNVTVLDDIINRTNKFAARIYRSPEAVMKRLGPTGQILFAAHEKAMGNARRFHLKYAKRLTTDFGRLKKAAQIPRHKLSTKKWAGPIFREFEENGPVGVERRWGKGAADIMEEIEDGFQNMLKEMVKLSTARPFAHHEIQAVAGMNGRLLPQMFKNPRRAQEYLSEEAIKKLYAARGFKLSKEGLERILAQRTSIPIEGLDALGSIEWQRYMPGSTAQKIANGIPLIDDPFEALNRYAAEVAHRVSLKGFAGPGGDATRVIKRAYTDSVTATGHSVDAMITMFDHLTGSTYHHEYAQALARVATSWQAISKLGLAFIPNMSQSVNTALFTGMKNFARGLVAMRDRRGRESVRAALGVMDQGPAIWGQTITTGGGHTPIERFTRRVLQSDLFSPSERWNRFSSGHAGLAMTRDIAARHIAGRLRGNSLQIARRKLASIGLDLDDIKPLYKQHGDLFWNSTAWKEMEETAIRRTAELTQFIPNKGSAPILWQTPAGRVITQFNSFAFNQAKFIRDQVFHEAAQGNLRPLTHFLSIYPLAGELVGDAVAIVKGRERTTNPLSRIIENYAHVGAMGLFYNTLIAARYGFLPSMILGPTGGTLTDLGAAIINGWYSPDDMSITRGLVDYVAEEPLIRYYSMLGAVTINSTDELIETLEGADTIDNESPMPISELTRRLL